MSTDTLNYESFVPDGNWRGTTDMEVRLAQGEADIRNIANSILEIGKAVAKMREAQTELIVLVALLLNEMKRPV
jgi:hypothetical protein